MRRLLVLSLFLSVFIANDEYPYFTDVSKQLEFEESRIYVNEVEEKEMIVSGGAQFNFLYLIDSTQPITVAAPIQTDYKYNYKFEIMQNSVLLDELSFLKIIGLEDKAKQYFNEQKELYPSTVIRSLSINSLIDKYGSLDNVPSSPEKIKELKAQEKRGRNFKRIGYLAPTIGVITFLWDTQKDLNLNIYYTSIFVGIGGFVFALANNQGLINIELENDKQFIYKQKLTNQQLTSLADSYNRKIYKEIQSK